MYAYIPESDRKGEKKETSVPAQPYTRSFISYHSSGIIQATSTWGPEPRHIS